MVGPEEKVGDVGKGFLTFTNLLPNVDTGRSRLMVTDRSPRRGSLQILKSVGERKRPHQWLTNYISMISDLNEKVRWT